jgi:hypothetical protein
VRADRERAKKLIVAFHFQFANQAAWKCDSCRQSGLERQRNCGWLRKETAAKRRPVWARKGVVVDTCPVSYISAQSLAWLEEYAAWKALRPPALWELPAKTVEAFCLLEKEMLREASDEQR